MAAGRRGLPSLLRWHVFVVYWRVASVFTTWDDMYVQEGNSESICINDFEPCEFE